MDFIHIKAADIEKARDYVPMGDKAAFVEYAAGRCIDKIAVTVEGDRNAPEVPGMYKISRERQERYLMGAFVKLYLGKKYESVEGDKWLMARDDFDRWCGGHVFAALEQAKRSAQTRDKAFDILADYRALKGLLMEETEGMLAVMNDPATRILAALSAPPDPEALKASMEELEALKGQLEEYRAERKE